MKKPQTTDVPNQGQPGPTESSAFIPWNSIAESVVDRPPKQLSWSDAKESPCLSCATSPCCTHLPLTTFKVTNAVELDHAIYLLNFDHIELGLSANGDWSAFYRYPCRFLDREKFLCTVHNLPEQPQICVSYDPFRCWYRRNLTGSISENYLRIDRPRMQFIVDRVLFDESRNIIEVPDWDTMTEGFAELVPETPAAPPEPSTAPPLRAEWQRIVLSPDEIEVEPTARSYSSLKDPCSECSAYCCTTLVFPQPQPASAANLDYLRFALGFPGVSLGITETEWELVVNTTCRHLENGRCSVYGQPERPLLCRYYDAWKCFYRPHFGKARPEEYLRIGLEEFEALTECFLFDDHGMVVAAASLEETREHIESRWRRDAEAPAAQPALAVDSEG
ncbi:MAG: hypothetical protein ACM3S1_01150 [Hyphomicrobiales bacterium]